MLLFCLLLAAASAREEVPFGFAWRFFLGRPGEAPSGPCNSTSFPINLTGTRCDGLQATDATTVPDCIAAACEQGASVWQLCSPANSSECSKITSKKLCWVGNPSSCDSKDASWLSGAQVTPTPGPTPSPTPPPPALPSFNDEGWDVVDAPHDFLISTAYNPAASNGQGSIPKNVSWYRKHLVLPADWQGSHVEVYFQGVFSVATVYLNGVPVIAHACGYTSFGARLDNVSGVVWGGENVLAIFVDATVTTGWWYEGGGLFREVSIIRSPLPARLADDGVFAPAFTEGAFHARGATQQGLYVDSATISPTVSVEVDASAPSSHNVTVRVDLYAADGATLLASSTSAPTPAQRGATALISPPPLTIANAELWSIARPYLHVLVASLLDGAGGGVLDAKNITVGVRSVRWDAINGAFVNEQHVKLRGFCNHNNFAGLGMGVPQRVNLLRLQQIRGMGGNSWRMSHNPGNPSTFDMGDRLGMTFLEENRVFNDDPGSVQNMRDMVRRDRVHPAIIFYSFCNEAGVS